MTKQIICSSCGESKPNYAKGLCKNCYQKIKYNTDEIWRQKRLKEMKLFRKKNKTQQAITRYSKEACDVLTQHADEHCNDDDKLTTDFIYGQIEKLRESKQKS